MGKLFTIDEIRKAAVPIAIQHGVRKIALFGSYAKNTAAPDSDIDFLVDASDIYGVAFFGLVDDLENTFGVHVDVVEYEALGDSYIRHVINDEVSLYER